MPLNSFAKSFRALLFLCAVLIPTAAFARGPEKPQSNIPAARKLISKAWNALDEEMSTQNLEKAVECLEKAAKLDPANAGLLAELSQEYFLRADQMPGNNPKELLARDQWFKKGISAAKESLAARETAAGHYWYAVNIASSVKSKSVFFQIKAFPAIRSNMLWVERNDKDYRYGAYAFFWGRLITEVPKEAIGIVGMDPDQVFQEMDDAIKVEPRFTQNRLYMAMFYYDRGKKKEALEILEQAIKIDPESLPDQKAQNRYSLNLAKETWKNWTGRNYPER